MDNRSAPRRLRAACLGGGYNSAVGRSHNVAMRMDHRFDVVAGCFSLDHEDNQLSALKYGIESSRLYNSLSQMLDQESDRVDALIVLTPTDQHAGQVIQALSAGIPVICEKALAVSVEEASQIKQRLLETRGFLAVIYNYLGYPMLRELRGMIAAGVLGDIQQIHIEMPQESFSKVSEGGDPMTPQSWRLQDHAVPTVSLDLGVHLHSIVSFLTGKRPTDVVALSSTFGNFPAVIDNVACLIRYEGQMFCNLWLSKTATGYRNGLKVRVFGNRASATWTQEDPEIIEFADCFGRRQHLDRASPSIIIAKEERYNRFKAGHPAGFVEAFANYYVDVADAIICHKIGAPPPPSDFVYGIELATEGLRLFESAVTSSATSQWVKL